MTARVFRFLRRVLVLLIVFAATLLVARAWDSQRGPDLEPWHTYVPHDMHADQIDKADWASWLKAEDAVFRGVRAEVTDKLDDEAKVPGNRYYDGSPIYPGHFAQDWNRSYILEPDGPPVGAVVLLHGLTDSPYSLRHIARRYRDEGFVAVAIRMPAHGTVPAALTDVEWEDWDAATRLAVREAVRRAGPGKPLHIVGFSNGGALAMKYALDVLDNKQLARPDRLILISPMIGITSFARFAGFAALPALLPAFAKAAWLGILPEFNPFKYNSFPVNGARQSHRLTAALQDRIARAARQGALERLPPILTFQSVVDFTVSTRAIISALYSQLPANGSELVLFDINRGATLGPLAAQRLRDRSVAHPRPAAAQVPDGDHHQRRRRHLQGGRAGDRGRRGDRADDRTCACVPARHLLAVACRLAVSGERFALWHAAGRGGRIFRRPSRLHCSARRAWRADRQSRCAAARIVQPVFSLPPRTDRARRRHRTGGP